MSRVFGCIAICLACIWSQGGQTQAADDDDVLTSDQLDKLLELVDEEIKALNTALILCQYYVCEEHAEHIMIYQSADGAFWFTAFGEVVD